VTRVLDQAPNTFRPDLAGDGLEKLEEVIQVRFLYSAGYFPAFCDSLQHKLLFFTSFSVFLSLL
jgi:hypothetical protein